MTDQELADKLRDLNAEMIDLIELATKRDIVVSYNVFETHKIGHTHNFTFELKIVKQLQEEL